MSLFDFGITSSKKRKSDTNIHGDEAKKKKNNKQAYEEKRERRYLGDIWGKKYVFFETFNGKPDGKSNPKTWIRYDEKSQEMYCILCDEFPAIADTKSPLYTGCKNLRDQPLKTHQQSAKHL